MQREGDAHPLVAVVTPVYNGGRFLRAAMDSVQRQTYPNLVHIVCNNASSDDTAEILAGYRHARVPVVVHENDEVLPLAANWNRAFSFLPEEAVYAKLLCADDLIRADAIARLVAVAQSDPEVEVVLSQDVFDDRVRRARLPQDRLLHDGREVARAILNGEAGWIAFHHFFVRVHPEDRDGHFIDDYWSPDPHVVVRSALRGKLGYVQAPLAFNRIHPDSVTGRELGRGAQFELVGMHLLEHFGPRAFRDRRELRRSTRALKRHGCRRAIRWRLGGQKRRSRELMSVMQSHGYGPGLWSYLSAIASWPANSLRWRRRDIPPGARIDEAEFTGTIPQP